MQFVMKIVDTNWLNVGHAKAWIQIRFDFLGWIPNRIDLKKLDPDPCGDKCESDTLRSALPF